MKTLPDVRSLRDNVGRLWIRPVSGLCCQWLGLRPLVIMAWSRYAGVIRYPDGGGLTAAERARRERVLHRLGWSVQVPARRAAERDGAAIAAWRQETWPVIKGPSRSRARGWSPRTSPGRG